MNAKAVLTFTFLVQFGNYAVIGESFVESTKHNYKITPEQLVSENVFSFEKALQFMGITKETYDRITESGVIADSTVGASPAP